MRAARGVDGGARLAVGVEADVARGADAPHWWATITRGVPLVSARTGKRGVAWAAALLFLAIAPAGCSPVLTAGTAVGAGAAGAGIAHAVTHNAAVTTGIGLGVLATANAGLQYTERMVHAAEQDRIAAAAGILPIGAVGHWQVSHNIPIEADEHGEVAVSRVLGDAGFRCKEIVFSVDRAGKQETHRAFYTATVCLDGTVWKWASAEPATERWGSLQ